MARSEEIRARSLDAMKSLEMMGLARRVEAVLIEAGFSSTSVSVSVLEPGKIQLTGFVGKQAEKVEAEEILKGVEGIKSLDNQIQVIEPYKYPV